MGKLNCYHCGDEIASSALILFNDKAFCCNGCKTVFEIFSENDLMSYYEIENNPGASPSSESKFDYLDNEEIVNKLLKFNENNQAVVTLYIPHIHCSSCIWILENLNKLSTGIVKSRVTFHEKNVQIFYDKTKTNLKLIAQLLAKIGYEPYISLENYDNKTKNIDRSLIYKVGVAFFSFGNVMLLSFPDYFEVDEFWYNQYKFFFRWLIFIIALPSFLYSGWGYYEAAYKSLKNKMLNIEVPMALGIIVMFMRSTYDIVFGHGQGFFDSMCSLIFFMLLGKLFQQKTYNFLSFERDYKSYFPIAVTKIVSEIETPTQIYELKKGDLILIRNQELIPVDGILISNEAAINYSFVTGEENPIEKKSGSKIFAGGKLIGSNMIMEVLTEVSQSYLTQLWSNEVFDKNQKSTHQLLVNKVSQFFTPILLILSILAFTYWSFVDVAAAFNVFTAMLIVACPCALALSGPFTMGNVLRIFGNQKFYIKNAQVIEQMATINSIVFDKTGTITSSTNANIVYTGKALTDLDETYIKSSIRSSNHPLSRKLYNFLSNINLIELTSFNEIIGNGVIATVNNIEVKVGSYKLLGLPVNKNLNITLVHISINNEYKGYFEFKNHYRKSVKDVFISLKNKYKLSLLSGDNDGELNTLKSLLPENVEMYFNQKPEQKLNFIAELQNKNQKVMMIGDGLNDSGALAKSDVGISISENVNVFSPACDAILDANSFAKIPSFLKFSKATISIIKASFCISIFYNIIGLTLACLNLLSPLIAAIIMPISTVSIVIFVTIASNLKAKKLGLK